LPKRRVPSGCIQREEERRGEYQKDHLIMGKKLNLRKLLYSCSDTTHASKLYVHWLPATADGKAWLLKGP